MNRFVLAAVLFGLCGSAAAFGPDDGRGGGCEDRNGNWFPSSDYSSSGIHPDGPCLPVGTWHELRKNDRDHAELKRRTLERLRNPPLRLPGH